jgi:polysaccharide biosynthesis protein PslH
VKLLFYKTRLRWPRDSGHDVYTYQTVRALANAGTDVCLALAEPPSAEAVAGLECARVVTLDDLPSAGPLRARLTSGEERFRSYWGVPEPRLRILEALVDKLRPQAVVSVGLDALPYLTVVDGAKRVWYPADEWLWHHLSQFRPTDRRTWGELSLAAVKGLYERVYRARVDRAWVVTESDARAMRWFAGVRNVDVIPYGVDAEYFSPSAEQATEDTAVFWGRLDFGPNIQALEWFCGEVWPTIIRQRPRARFTIMGFAPGSRVARLASRAGVDLLSDVQDIRPEAAQRAVVVLPFVSGGGIKNKLLEAAALGLPIVCSSRTRSGLRGTPPLRFVDRPAEWRDALTGMWDDRQQRVEAGRLAREWVVREHSWEASAAAIVDLLRDPS